MIISLMDLELIQFLSEIEAIGIKLCLVGGAVRDFYLNQKLNTDLDFEIRIDQIRDFPSEIENFFKNNKLNFEKLPYQIYRIHFNQYSIELSSPRTEKFYEDNFHHHNFKATIDYRLQHRESFKRRDFTINAIGIEFDFANKKEELIDPYQGLVDLKSKILRNVSEDFFQDAVRFLRMIRFKNNLNFKIESNLEKNIDKFDLSQLSKFHFESEMFKAHSLSKFIDSFTKYNSQYPLKLNPQYSFFTKINLNNGEVKDRLDFTCWIACNEERFLDDCLQFFIFKKNIKQDLINLKHAFQFLSNPANKKRFPTNQDFFESELFYHLKFLNGNEDLRKRMLNYLNLKEHELILCWKDWEELKLTKLEIDSELEQYRSSLKLYKAYINKYGN